MLASGTGWNLGVDSSWFAEMISYWRDEFDWRAQEVAINRLPQFTTSPLGARLHFVHRRSGNPTARPLLLLHGWPYSFWTFSEVIEPLAKDFHVVVPSLPGVAFSEPIDVGPRGYRAISRHIHALMTDVLGYSRYFMQGGDQGAIIADWLALDMPEAILGEQTNAIALTGLDHRTADEKLFIANAEQLFAKEGAYFDMQATRPETIAYAMTDSPVGAAAYLLDKWQKWTDTRLRPLDRIYDRDRLLTEVMLYVATGSFATSIWPYVGRTGEPASIPAGRLITVPFGYSGYAERLRRAPPREYAASTRSRIVQWEFADSGGHFPAIENPTRFVDSVRAFAALADASRSS